MWQKRTQRGGWGGSEGVAFFGRNFSRLSFLNTSLNHPHHRWQYSKVGFLTHLKLVLILIFFNFLFNFKKPNLVYLHNELWKPDLLLLLSFWHKTFIHSSKFSWVPQMDLHYTFMKFIVLIIDCITSVQTNIIKLLKSSQQVSPLQSTANSVEQLYCV